MHRRLLNWKALLPPLSALLSIPILNVFYSMLNHGGRGAHSLVTDLDRIIPFVKLFIIPYVIWYPFILITLVYMCIQDRATYYRTLIALDLGLLVCYAVYFVYQTTVPRPALTGDDPLTAMVAWIYGNDAPFNCFPSIHVLTSYLMIKGVRNVRQVPFAVKMSVTALGFAIIASTLFVKQHVLLDVAGAIVAAEFMFRLVRAATGAVPALLSVWKRRESVWRRKPYSLSTMKKKF